MNSNFSDLPVAASHNEMFANSIFLIHKTFSALPSLQVEYYENIPKRKVSSLNEIFLIRDIKEKIKYFFLHLYFWDGKLQAVDFRELGQCFLDDS